MTLALEADGLGKRYGNAWALRNCSLQLPTGRVVGLVGPNGAGKTTLTHLAMGLLEPTKGSICILGYVPRKQVREVLSRVGFVAQNRPLYKHFSAEKHLLLGKKLNTHWDDARAREHLRHLALPFDRKAGTLSGGQQAQLSLVLALAKKPKLLLLDEPLANLDPLARQEFLRTLLVAATEEGITIVFSSHVIAELERFCDYLIVLVNGQVQLAGDVDELLAGHKRFTCDREVAAGLDGDPGILALTQSERHISRIEHLQSNVSRIGWKEHDVTLEELVLASMMKPTAEQGPVLFEQEREELTK